MRLSIPGFRSWSIRWQIGVVLVAAQIAANIITAIIADGMFSERRLAPEAAATDVVAPFVLLVKVIQHLDPAQANATIRAAVAADPRLSIVKSFTATTQDDALGRSGHVLLNAARNGVDPAWIAKVAVSVQPHAQDLPMADFSFSGHAVAVMLASGDWLMFSPSIEGLRSVVPRFGPALAFMVLVLPLAGAAFWATWALVTPLANLAHDAQRFSQDLDATPIALTGSLEIRKVGESFNLMRSRIKNFVEARTRAMAAISHDLRTPLTRMRLRIEMLDNVDEQAALLADVSYMEKMTRSVLAHLRDQHAAASFGHVDIAALIQTVCDEFATQGHPVTYAGSDRKVVVCDATLIRRCLVNLIDNAVVYGGGAEVRLADLAPDGVGIAIVDQGPGIATADREALFEPFRRGDSARGGAGFGLGLSIAREIVAQHGGTIELADNEPHGLVVRIVLPVSAPATNGASISGAGKVAAADGRAPRAGPGSAARTGHASGP